MNALVLIKNFLFCVLVLTLVACGVQVKGDGHGYGGTRPTSPGDGTKIGNGSNGNGSMGNSTLDPEPTPPSSDDDGVVDVSQHTAQGCACDSGFLVCRSGQNVSVTPSDQCQK